MSAVRRVFYPGPKPVVHAETGVRIDPGWNEYVAETADRLLAAAVVVLTPPPAPSFVPPPTPSAETERRPRPARAAAPPEPRNQD